MRSQGRNGHPFASQPYRQIPGCYGRRVLKSSFLSLLIIGALTAFGSRAAAQSTPAWLDTLLQTASEGAALSLGSNTIPSATALNVAPNQLRDQPTTGRLVYSDDPETVEGFGVLYRENLPAGPSRLYTYHVNGTATRSKVTAVLTNEGSEAASFTVTRRAIPTPSANYSAVGRTALQRWFLSSASAPVVVPAGGAALLDPALDTTGINFNQLLHGIHDFTTDRPLRLTVLHLPLTTATLSEYAAQPMLEDDGFFREGTFAALTRSSTSPYSYNMSSGIRKLRLADGNSTWDANLAGTDSDTAAATTLKGNYGLVYDLKVNVAPQAGRRLAVLLSARGGAYGGYFRVSYGGAAPRDLLVPTSKVAIQPTTEAGVVALIDPEAAPGLLRIETIPAGAMSLPIELYLVPFTDTRQRDRWTLY